MANVFHRRILDSASGMLNSFSKWIYAEPVYLGETVAGVLAAFALELIAIVVRYVEIRPALLHTFGHAHFKWDTPLDLTFNGCNDSIYVIGSRARVKVFSAQGKYLRNFEQAQCKDCPSPYRVSNGFYHCKLACDKRNGEIYVGGCRYVQVFSSEGTYLREWSWHPDYRYLPTTMTVAHDGLVLCEYKSNIRVPTEWYLASIVWSI